VIGDFFTRIPAGATKLGGSVEVISALTLTSAEQGEVKDRLGVKNATFKVDPGILGGLIIRAGDRVIDGSVKSGVTGLAAQMR
jgi:F0F1-type ATP synthase delta subunit